MQGFDLVHPPAALDSNLTLFRSSFLEKSNFIANSFTDDYFLRKGYFNYIVKDGNKV